MANHAKKDIELSQDMHLKMCKKIAQLTKVIYALHTKNDENEATVTAINESHEEQLRKFRSDTQLKIDQYQQKVQDLTERLKQSELAMKANAENQSLELHKKQSSELETKLRLDYDNKLSQISDELSATKKDLSSKISLIDHIRDELRLEKENAISEIEAQHQRNLTELSRIRQNKEAELRQELEISFKKELLVLEERIGVLETEKKTLANERVRLEEENDSKLAKAKAFYENELQVLKNSQTASHEERFNALQQLYDKLRKDTAFENQLSKQRENELIGRISLSDELSGQLTQENNKLTQDVSSLKADIVQLNIQITDLKAESSKMKANCTRLEAEFRDASESLQRQTTELLQKSSHIAQLEADKLHSAAAVSNLMSESEDLKEKLARLEGLKQNLEKKNATLTEEQQQRLETLQKSLNDNVAEQTRMKTMHGKELEETKQAAKQVQLRLTDEHQEELRRKSEEMKTTMRETEARYLTMEQDLKAQMKASNQKLEKENSRLQQELNTTKEELNKQLALANAELRRLEGLLNDSQSGLGSASALVEQLRSSCLTLRVELDSTKESLLTSIHSSKQLQAECDSLKLLQEQTTKEAKEQLNLQLQQLRSQLDSQWEERLQRECNRLRGELVDQSLADKRLAVSQLTEAKDAEIAVVKENWMSKVNELLKEITGLKQAAMLAAKDHSATEEKFIRQRDEDLQRHRKELSDMAVEHANKIDSLRLMYEENTKTHESGFEEKLKELESGLRHENMESSKALNLAHSVALESLRDKLEEEKHLELEAVQRQCQEDLEGLRTELEHRHAAELDEAREVHRQEIQVSKLTLDRVLESARQKESLHAMAVSELQDEVKTKQNLISRLSGEVLQLRKTCDETLGELGLTREEIVQIRNEATLTLRMREEELKKKRKEEIARVKADHSAEKQAMLAEFSEAQRILKNKIGEMLQLLQAADERYQNRESRDEDILTIERLQNELKLNEEIIRKLNNEKRYFQMELVNRETNFNKVFNADPKVGFLNPLTISRKAKTKDAITAAAPRHSSSSSGTGSRLDPLPGSPHHDEKWNALKPIPPTKQFLH